MNFTYTKEQVFALLAATATAFGIRHDFDLADMDGDICDPYCLSGYVAGCLDLSDPTDDTTLFEVCARIEASPLFVELNEMWENSFE